MNLEKIWYLKKINFFSGLSREEMELLAKRTQMKQYRRKEVLYLPGDPGNTVFLLKKGIVKLSRLFPDGRELTLVLLKPGEIFGELEVLDESARDTQATAYSDTLICVLRKEDLLGLLEKQPSLAIRLSKLIGFRRKYVENRVESLLFRNSHEKLAKLLLDLVAQFGKEDTRGTRIDLSLTHQELANLIGAVRETVSNILLDFKKKGWIENRGKVLIVHSRRDLEAIAKI